MEHGVNIAVVSGLPSTGAIRTEHVCSHGIVRKLSVPSFCPVQFSAEECICEGGTEAEPGGESGPEGGSFAEVHPAWVNSLVGRIFWDFLREKYWSDKVAHKIQKKLSKIRVSWSDGGRGGWDVERWTGGGMVGCTEGWKEVCMGEQSNGGMDVEGWRSGWMEGWMDGVYRGRN